MTAAQCCPRWQRAFCILILAQSRRLVLLVGKEQTPTGTKSQFRVGRRCALLAVAMPQTIWMLSAVALVGALALVIIRGCCPIRWMTTDV